MTPWENNLANNMSGGQQQRVTIARALAMSPALVLADEPTGNLDTIAANTVFDMMQRVNKESGTTFLIVTHNMDMARRCQRVIEVVDGRVVPRKVRAAPGSMSATTDRARHGHCAPLECLNTQMLRPC